MAGKAAPLDGFEFNKFTFENDGKLWACLKSNKGEGNYSFKGDDFVLKANVFTGLVEGDNYWLVATLASGSCLAGGSFDLQIREQKDGKWGINKEESEKQIRQWQIDGCNALILANEIPVLKTLVKVLDELKIILKPGNGEIVVRYNIEADKCPKIEEYLALFLVKALTGELPAPNTPEYEAAGEVSKIGLMALPVLVAEKLPQKTVYDPVFGQPTGTVIDCFPFEGNLPSYTRVLVTPPKASEKKAGGRGGYGTNVQTTVTAYLSPSEREKYICDSLRAMGMTLEGDDIGAIHKAVNSLSSAEQQATFMKMLRLAYQMTTDTWILG